MISGVVTSTGRPERAQRLACLYGQSENFDQTDYLNRKGPALGVWHLYNRLNQLKQ